MESSTIRGDINDLDINYLILIVFTRYRVFYLDGSGSGSGHKSTNNKK
jgi:hypothetical protein